MPKCVNLVKTTDLLEPLNVGLEGVALCPAAAHPRIPATKSQSAVPPGEVSRTIQIADAFSGVSL